MSHVRSTLLIAAAVPALLLLGGCATGFDAVRHPQPGEITVSSANYAATPMKDILKSIDDTSPADPKAVRLQLKPLAQPKFYLFAPGEFYESDISFDEVARLLTLPLAEKGYLQATNAARAGKNPDKRIDLVLRVHCGERYWRDPVVRTTELTWNDGLVSKAFFDSADTSGNSTVWDVHAGGDDLVLAEIEQAIGNAAASSSSSSGSSSSGGAMPMGGGGGGRGGARGGGGGVSRGQQFVGLNDPNNPVGGLSSELTSLPTREFFLVVVEAFDFKELQQKRGAAKRIWTTFVAVPKKGKEKFSDVLPALLRAAEPYFGETTRGLDVYNEDNARVEIGEPYEVSPGAKNNAVENPGQAGPMAPQPK